MHATRGEKMAGALMDLLGKPARRERMAAAARGLAKHDAVEEIATLVEDCGARNETNPARQDPLPSDPSHRRPTAGPVSGQDGVVCDGRVLGGDAA